MAAKKRRKAKSATGKKRKKAKSRKAKSKHVPLTVLKKRLVKLSKIVKSRGG